MVTSLQTVLVNNTLPTGYFTTGGPSEVPTNLIPGSGDEIGKYYGQTTLVTDTAYTDPYGVVYQVGLFLYQSCLFFPLRKGVGS